MGISALKVGLVSIIAMVGGSGTPSIAQSPDEFSNRGDSFVRACGDAGSGKPTDLEQALFCIFYAKGVFDAGIDTTLKACEPQGVNIGQRIDIGIEYIRRNPDKAHWPASVLLLMGLRQAYPCPKTAK